MFEVMKAVITSRQYVLEDMLRKVDVVWLQGQITEQEREELIRMARENADPAMSLDLYEALGALAARVDALEGKSGDNWPDYDPRKIYHRGNPVTFEGKHYRCTAPDGMPCSWSPADYPAYWTEA